MAYAFEKIQNILDPNKKNIFAEAQDGQTGPENLDTAQDTLKTEASGDISSSGPKNTNLQPASQSDAQAARSIGATQRAFEASKQASPANISAPLSRVSEKLGQASQNLQEEANQFLTGEKAKQVYDVSREEIGKAIGGEKEAGAKVSQTMGMSAPRAVQSFAPKTDYTVEDIENFQSTPGLSRYLRGQYGPSYTAGAAAFDVQRLRSSPEFQKSVSALQSEQNRLNELAKGYLAQDTGLEAQARQYGTENLAASQKAIKEYLGGAQSSLEAENEAEYQAYLQKLKEMEDPQSAARKALAAQSQGDINKRIEEVIAMRPELAKYLTPQNLAAFGMTPEQFIDVASKEGISSQSFYNPEEAARFNRIMGFLGTGGQAKMPGTMPGPAGTFNVEKFATTAAQKAEAANVAADIQARKTIEAALNRARTSRDLAAKQYARLPEELQQIAGQAREALGQGPIDAQIVDPNAFFKAGAVSGSELDYLYPEDVAAVNAAYEELMDPRRLEAGKLLGQSRYSFDTEGYKNAVRQALAQRAGMPETQSQGSRHFTPAEKAAMQAIQETPGNLIQTGAQIASDIEQFPGALGKAVKKIPKFKK